MTLWRFRLPFVACCAVLLVSLLGGCTKEKALALKASGEAFRDRAIAAIEYYEELMVTGAFDAQRSDTEVFQEAVTQLKALGKVTGQNVNAALDSADARERALKDVGEKLKDVRLAYIAYAGAFARLPEGSFLATDAVSCSAGLGVRLTQRLAVFAELAYRAPVRYQARFARGVGELNSALAAKNDAQILKATSDLFETRRAERRDNAEAVARFAEAIEAGTRTVGLAKSYGELTVEDLLAGLNRILEIRSKYFGVDSDRVIARVTEFRAQLEQDPAFKEILALPIADQLPACKAN